MGVAVILVACVRVAAAIFSASGTWRARSGHQVRPGGSRGPPLICLIRAERSKFAPPQGTAIAPVRKSHGRRWCPHLVRRVRTALSPSFRSCGTSQAAARSIQVDATMLALMATIIPMGLCLCLGAKCLGSRRAVGGAVGPGRDCIPPASSNYDALLLEVERYGDRLR